MGIKERRVIRELGRSDYLRNTLESVYALRFHEKNADGKIIIEFFPLSKHREHIRIEIPEGYIFLRAFVSRGKIVSLWGKDSIYHLLKDGNMENTGISMKEVNLFNITILNGNLVASTHTGLWTNDIKISGEDWDDFDTLDDCHLIYRGSNRICRIKYLEDIKVKSCTKRT